MIVRPYQIRTMPYPRSPSISLRSTTGGTRVIGGFQLEAISPPSRASADQAFLDATRGLSPYANHLSHPPYGYIQSLFLTTTATQAESAIEGLVAGGRISPATSIVLLMNGMGVYERLVRTFFQDLETRPQFILTTNTHGAVRAREGLDVLHTASGQIHYGVVADPLGRDQRLKMASSTSTTPTANSLNQSDPFYSLRRTIQLLDALSPHLSVAHEHIAELHHRRFLKLVVNCCVNPLTAIKDCLNGQLLEDPEARKTIGEICEEAAAILQRQTEIYEEENSANLIDTSTMLPLTGLVEETIDEREARMSRIVNRLPLRRTPTAEDLEAEVIRVIKLTSENTSSMLQDVRKGQKTEIQFINGAFTALGREYGVLTPCNDALADMLCQKESEAMFANRQR
ncbi:2-dehydropantoate 2-reductase (Ketopantoate reductase) (KPA reductase) (KPR) [Tulasnella sp. JGI-2019a]|nr:2-dehydropantoate 2-reductase (Ketopantoate reductase) (KPA reductase) (KPR) [Tulasnella sp. JGI-2019a]